MARSPRVSVIVPSYNSGEQLQPSLHALFSQLCAGDMEVIVVDDGSTDGSIEAARDIFPSIAVVRTERLGCDGARQAGMDAASGEVLANTDADCVVSPTWLEGISAALANGASAVTGPVIHNTDLTSTMVAITDFPDFQGLRRRKVRNFPGCNFALTRGTLDRYGYQVRKELTCGSDRLFAWRLSSSGGTIAYEPRAMVRHFPTANAGSLFRRHRRYAVTALCIRKLDPSLPGGRFSRFGRIAAPVYCGARLAKDIALVGQLTVQRRVAPWQIPILLAWAPLLRAFDLASMLDGRCDEVIVRPTQPNPDRQMSGQR